MPKGWSVRIVIATTFGALVLVLDTVFLAVAIQSRRRGGSVNVSIRAGKCEEVSHINTIAHVSINIIGTLLLGCSSLVMQMLSAPTREDIDAAHSKQSWLDIGVLSLRNVAFFGYARKACWLMLALSSLPLHLM
jgi:hypothetical protein